MKDRFNAPKGKENFTLHKFDTNMLCIGGLPNGINFPRKIKICPSEGILCANHTPKPWRGEFFILAQFNIFFFH